MRPMPEWQMGLMSYTRSFLAGVCKGAFLGACFVAGFGYGTCPVFPGPDPDELLREHEQRIRDAARDFAWAVGTLEIDDFEQAGRVGAYKAAARWRSDLGPFWAFAASYVRYGMLHELNRQGRTITQPERALKRKDRPAHLVVRMRHEIADSREHGRVFAILGAD
jgi:DNA-directed RNA polymerase specialized sigma subunit